MGKKILIIGTFNPDVPCNKAEFFYGRAKNYFWDLLPSMFGKESLKGDVQKQKEFLETYDIELSDLILLVMYYERFRKQVAEAGVIKLSERLIEQES